MVFTDGSSKRMRGWEQAGFGGFYGEGDARNFAHPLDPLELQTNGRAEVRAILFAMRQCTGLTPMAVVTNSEFCFNGLTKHLLLWERRDWLGVSHADQWVRILELARDPSKQYTFFLVPSHVSIEGNEGADRQAEAGRLLHEYNMQPLQKRQRPNPTDLPEQDESGRGGRERAPLPPVTSWLLSEASFVLEEEEGGSPSEQGESDIDPYEQFLGDLMGPESLRSGQWPPNHCPQSASGGAAVYIVHNYWTVRTQTRTACEPGASGGQYPSQANLMHHKSLWCVKELAPSVQSGCK